MIRPRSRRLATVAVLALSGTTAITALAGPTVSAAETSAYTADAGAALVRLDGTLATTSVADIDVFPSEASVSTATTPRSSARGANLDAAVLGTLDLGDVLTSVSQSAPADNPAATADTLLAVPASPVVDVEASNASAHARWAGDGVCPSAATPISQARTDLARTELLSTPLTGPLAVLTHGDTGTGATHSTLRTTSVPGSGLGLTSTAGNDSVHAVVLGGTSAEIGIEVAEGFAATATATGVAGGAETSVTWPVVTITLPGGIVVGPIEADDLEPVVYPLSGELDALLGATTLGSIEISAGDATETVTADGTSASVTGHALRVALEVSPGGTSLVDAELAISPLSAAAVVPAGGITCEEHDPFRDVAKDATTTKVAPGGQFDYTLLVPNTASCTLTDVSVVDTIDQAPAGSKIVATSPAATEVNGLTARWAVPSIAPGVTELFTITVEVPADAVADDRFFNVLETVGTCGDVVTTGGDTFDGPVVRPVASGACNLGSSNKAASHEEAAPTDVVVYHVHVFNHGGADCTGVTIVDVLDPRLALVECDGCTTQGQRLTWELGTIPAGSGRTVSYSARVDGAATGDVPNVAEISSPDDPDGPYRPDEHVLVGTSKKKGPGPATPPEGTPPTTAPPTAPTPTLPGGEGEIARGTLAATGSNDVVLLAGALALLVLGALARYGDQRMLGLLRPGSRRR